SSAAAGSTQTGAVAKSASATHAIAPAHRGRATTASVDSAQTLGMCSPHTSVTPRQQSATQRTEIPDKGFIGRREYLERYGSLVGRAFVSFTVDAIEGSRGGDAGPQRAALPHHCRIAVFLREQIDRPAHIALEVAALVRRNVPPAFDVHVLVVRAGSPDRRDRGTAIALVAHLQHEELRLGLSPLLLGTDGRHEVRALLRRRLRGLGRR